MGLYYNHFKTLLFEFFGMMMYNNKLVPEKLKQEHFIKPQDYKKEFFSFWVSGSKAAGKDQELLYLETLKSRLKPFLLHNGYLYHFITKSPIKAV